MEIGLDMVTLYTVCAVGGGIFMLAQVGLSVLGVDADAEEIGDIGDDLEVGDEYVDTHNISTWFFGILSLRSIVAAIAFFGIAGRVSVAFGAPALLAFMVAVLAGLVAMVLIALLMKILHGLHSEGNVHIRNAVGAAGTVYLAVPGNNSGQGKVTVAIQNRTMEYAAVTNGVALETGARVIVVAVADPSTLEVARELAPKS